MRGNSFALMLIMASIAILEIPVDVVLVSSIVSLRLPRLNPRAEALDRYFGIKATGINMVTTLR